MSRTTRVFVVFFVILFSVFGVLGGLILADYETRRIGYGDYTPVFQIETDHENQTTLSIDTLGIEKTISLTPLLALWDKLQSVLSEFSPQKPTRYV